MNNSHNVCDDEWMLRKTEGTYFLRIGDFASKINWSPGNFIDSQIFIIGNTKFKLRFFPNVLQGPRMSSDVAMSEEYVEQKKEEKDEDHRCVGVYLFNQSGFDVLVDFKMTLSNRVKMFQKQFLRANECIGWSSFFTHLEIMNQNVLNREGKLEARVDITTNWERKVEKDLSQSFKNSDLLQGILQEMRKLREDIAGVHVRLDCYEQRSQPEVAWPRCVNCGGCLRPPFSSTNTIQQCLAGHLSCELCLLNLKENPCALCKDTDGYSYAGRAVGLESYLNSISGKQKSDFNNN